VTGWGEGLVPDGIEPLVAYRSWSFEKPAVGVGLLSLNQLGGPWLPGRWNWAVCPLPLPNPHQAPSESCTCGFYAAKDLETLARLGLVMERSNRQLITGRVLLAGKVIEHEHGYRAERAKVLEILPGPGQDSTAAWIALSCGVSVGRELIDRWDELCPRDLPPAAGVPTGIRARSRPRLEARIPPPLRSTLRCVRLVRLGVAAVFVLAAFLYPVPIGHFPLLLLPLIASRALHAGKDNLRERI
jgi:hypothetical protein